MIRRLLYKFKKKRDLTSGSIAKNIWILAIPMIISNLLQAGFNLVDMFWVGKLGPDALAAVAMSGSILMIVMFVMIGIGVGTTAMISRSIGEGNKEKADAVAMQSLILGLLGSIFFALLGYFFSPWLLKILGAESNVLALGTSYMQILFIGVIAMFWMFLIAAILNGAGDAATPMLILSAVTIVNIILDPILIFGFQLGIRGAALATILSEALGSIMALNVLLQGKSHIHVKLKYIQVNLAILFQIVKIGIPASMMMILRGFLNIALIAIVASFGTYAVAAFGVGIRLNMLALMPGFALGMAAATLVGQNLGAQKPDRAQASAWLTTAYYAGFMFLMTIILWFFAPKIIALFNQTPKVIEIGVHYLRMTVLGYVFVAMGIVLSRSLSGSGDTISPLIITFITLWLVQIPLAIYLSQFTSLGLTGVWLAILTAYILQGLMSAFWFQMGKWKARII